MSQFIKLTQFDGLPVLFDTNIINMVRAQKMHGDWNSVKQSYDDQIIGSHINYGEQNNTLQVRESVEQIEALLSPGPFARGGIVGTNQQPYQTPAMLSPGLSTVPKVNEAPRGQFLSNEAPLG